MKQYLLSVDQGTTSSRAILFDENARSCFTAQKEFTQYFPEDGWVEHDPEEIWSTILDVMKQAIAWAKQHEVKIAAMGITNQRETTVVWDRATGQVVYNAIVWQDRRSARYCDLLRERGLEAMISEKTGLLLDPYFSATKINWILNHVDGALERTQRGELAFGTIDSFLIWRLTEGEVHATDATNASRTMLFDINQQCWDQELLDAVEVPYSVLPEVKDSSDDYGLTSNSVVGEQIAICGRSR